MPVYLIAYDINAIPSYDRRPGISAVNTEEANTAEREVNRRRTAFLAQLTSIYDNHKISESVYAISTERSMNEVSTELLECVEEQDDLFVLPISEPFEGQGTVLRWARARIR